MAYRSSSARSALALGALLTAPAFEAEAQTMTYLVDRADDSTVGDCLVEVEADCPLRRAMILAAFDGVTSIVQVPDGLYQLDLSGPDEDASFTGDLDVYGTDSVTALPGARPIIEQTTLDRVIEVHELDDVATRVTLSGLTLRGGGVVGAGGGLYLLRTGPPLKIRGRAGSQARGADLPVLLLSNVVITANQATGAGGGLFITRPSDALGAVVLDGVTVQGNVTADGGGGAALIGGPVEIYASSFLDNVAEELGGGLALGSRNALLEDVRIHGNRVEGGSEPTGGGLLFAGDGVIRRSSIAWNRAGDGTALSARGGGIRFAAGTPAGNLFLDNVTVAHNQTEAIGAETGAQIAVDMHNLLDLDQVTISDSSGNGGLHVESLATVRFEGSAIDGGCDLEVLVDVVTQGYTLERPPAGSNTTCLLDSGKGDVVSTDLLLAPPAVYGGAAGVLTMPPGPTSPARLLVGSTHCLAEDGRGATRGSLFCTAGSHESGAAAVGGWIFADGFESGELGAWLADP